MNYGKIIYCDIANGEGCRTSLFVSGCRNHCKGCFNEITWPFDYGDPFTEEVEEEILNSLQSGYIDGISILGGEPMEDENVVCLIPFVKKVRDIEKTVWVYSGYTFEELQKHRDFLELIDVLVDGRFVEELKDITLRFRGSSNQRIIDVQKSLKENRVVLWND